MGQLQVLHGNFYPRPPRGGRPDKNLSSAAVGGISIHALREEGDATSRSAADGGAKFLSTPSARRATTPALGFAT